MPSESDLDPRTLVDSAPVPWAAIRAGLVTRANAEFGAVLGVSAGGVEGRRLADLVVLEDRGVLRSLLSARGRWHQPVRAMRADGQMAHLVLSAAPVDATGTLLVVAFDATEQHHDAEELRRLRNEAIGLAERQQAFVASVTHELRSPLHAILGLGELLVADAGPEHPPELARLMDAARRLGQTVDQLLELARADSEEVRLDLADVHLASLVAQVARRTGAASNHPGVTLSVTVDPDAPDQIRGDAYRLDQILTNLISNAITHTDEGSVEVTVAVRHGIVEFEVSDTGPGVPADFHEAIFQPFVRAPGSPVGGTGLGLPLVRSIARALHGDVSLTCPPEGGSVFTVRLPLLPPGSRIGAAASVPPSSAGSPGVPVPAPDLIEERAPVLVVEDTEMIQLLAERQLQRLGYQPVVVGTGAEALAAAVAAPDRYEVVLMDMQLPDGNGSDVTRQLRAAIAGSRSRHLPVIAITANAMPDTRAECMAAGMDDFLAKPVSIQALGRVLDRVCAGATAVPAGLVLDRGQLTSLAHDPDRTGRVLESARGHLDLLEDDLRVMGVDSDPRELRRRVRPHLVAMATLGFRRVASWIAASGEDTPPGADLRTHLDDARAVLESMDEEVVR